MSGRHEWLDPASARRCCACRFERILVGQDEIPADAFADGRTYLADELAGLVFVWIPRRSPRRYPYGIPQRVHTPNGALAIDPGRLAAIEES